MLDKLCLRPRLGRGGDGLGGGARDHHGHDRYDARAAGNGDPRSVRDHIHALRRARCVNNQLHTILHKNSRPGFCPGGNTLLRMERMAVCP